MNTLRAVWIETIAQFPTYNELLDAGLFYNKNDISLPLAPVCLASHLAKVRPSISFTYIPRRMSHAAGDSVDIEQSMAGFDVVMTGCSTADSGDARRILTAAKKLGKTTVIGGIYPTYCPSVVLAWGVADYVCIGEGELSLVRVLDQIAGIDPQTQISGVITPSNPKPTMPELVDLHQLQSLRFDDFVLQDSSQSVGSPYVLASRGCPAHCSFCTSARLYGHSYRTRPIEHVVRELDLLYSSGFKRITLADDTILGDPNWAMQLFRQIADTNPGYRLKVRARADELTRENIACMVDAGVQVVQFGVESASNTVRNRMGKNLAAPSVENAYELILANPELKANPLFMLAYPGETWEDYNKNLDYIRKQGANDRVYTYLSFTTPYPGTVFARGLNRRGGIFATKELGFYTNKFPVYIPRELLGDGFDSALDELVDSYHKLCDYLNQYTPIHSRIPAPFFDHLDPSPTGP